MSKKKFRVTAKGTEYLAERIIEAATADEAEEKYRDLWENGCISACDYEMEYTTTEVHEKNESSTCEYGYDCYYRVGNRCKFYDFSPCEEPMACHDVEVNEEEDER
jgi:hypothetical protein